MSRCAITHMHQKNRKTMERRIWRILAIDGGGIRGIIPAVVLAEIERRIGSPICQLFDMVTGTSTGGILALGLCVPTPESKSIPLYSATDLANLYFEHGPVIFRKSFMQELKEWIFGGSQYSNKGIDASVQAIFGGSRIGQACTNIMIPTYDLEKRIPHFFKSWDEGRDAQCLMKEIARATSAAPTYFTPAQLGGRGAFVDGGLIAMNPALSALVECRRYAQADDSFFVVSLGTGKYQKTYTYEHAIRWRPFNWAEVLLDVIMDGASTTTDYELLQLSRRPQLQYFRFQTILPPQVGAMDDTNRANMESLKKLGNRIFLTEMKNEFQLMLAELEQLKSQAPIRIEWEELLQKYKPKNSH